MKTVYSLENNNLRDFQSFDGETFKSLYEHFVKEGKPALSEKLEQVAKDFSRTEELVVHNKRTGKHTVYERPQRDPSEIFCELLEGHPGNFVRLGNYLSSECHQGGMLYTGRSIFEYGVDRPTASRFQAPSGLSFNCASRYAITQEEDGSIVFDQSVRYLAALTFFRQGAAHGLPANIESLLEQMPPDAGICNLTSQFRVRHGEDGFTVIDPFIRISIEENDGAEIIFDLLAQGLKPYMTVKHVIDESELSRDEDSTMGLMYAAQQGDTDRVSALLKGKDAAFLNTITKKSPRFCALDFAIANGHTETARAILIWAKENISSPEETVSVVNSALMQSVMSDQAESLRSLFEIYDGDGNLQREDLRRAFQIAIRRHSPATMNLLWQQLDRKFQPGPEGSDDRFFFRLITESINESDLLTIKNLHNLGINLNLRDEQGNTPLLVALIHGKFAIAEQLVKLGADPTITNDAGVSPMTLEADNRRIKESLASVIAAARHRQSFTALDESLLRSGTAYGSTEVNPKDIYYNLKAAIEKNVDEAFRLIEEFESQGLPKELIIAGINYVNPESGTTLLIDAYSNSATTALFLLNKGADPDYKGPGGSFRSLWSTWTNTSFLGAFGEPEERARITAYLCDHAPSHEQQLARDEGASMPGGGMLSYFSRSKPPAAAAAPDVGTEDSPKATPPKSSGSPS